MIKTQSLDKRGLKIQNDENNGQKSEKYWEVYFDGHNTKRDVGRYKTIEKWWKKQKIVRGRILTNTR